MGYTQTFGCFEYQKLNQILSAGLNFCFLPLMSQRKQRIMLSVCNKILIFTYN